MYNKNKKNNYDLKSSSKVMHIKVAKYGHNIKNYFLAIYIYIYI